MRPKTNVLGSNLMFKKSINLLKRDMFTDVIAIKSSVDRLVRLYQKVGRQQIFYAIWIILHQPDT